MKLCQLPAQTDGAVSAEDFRHIRQRGHQLVGGFVENHRPGLGSQGVQMLPAAFFRRGEEALKAEPAGGLPGNAQRRDGGAGTGDGANDDAGFSALLDQVLPGVGDGGTARVGDQRAGLPGENAVNDPVALRGLVMLVVADKAFFDAQMVEQFQRHPRILGGDEVGAFQRLPAAQGDIPQIADGGRDKIQHSSHVKPPRDGKFGGIARWGHRSSRGGRSPPI